MFNKLSEKCQKHVKFLHHVHVIMSDMRFISRKSYSSCALAGSHLAYTWTVWGLSELQLLLIRATFRNKFPIRFKFDSGFLLVVILVVVQASVLLLVATASSRILDFSSYNLCERSTPLMANDFLFWGASMRTL